MSNKLVLQDLVDLLAKKSKITKKEADSFFRELFQIILDRIFENDSVKIKDFGTFKLVLVSSRESVDVNTGEKIEIKAHSKLSFVPDKVLKGLVNKPFSQFETILLEDDMDFDSSLDADDELDNEIEEKEYIIDIPEKMQPESTPEVKINNEDIPLPANEARVVEEEIKEEQRPIEEKTEKDRSIVYPSFNQSFVYTYTTSSSDTSDSITITLPKEEQPQKTVPASDVLPESSNIEDTDTAETNNIEDKSDKIISEPPKEEPVNTEVKPLEQEQAVVAEDIAIGKSEISEIISPVSEDKEDKPEENISKLVANERRYIEPIAPVDKSDQEDLYIDSDSEIETEEDIVLPPPILPLIRSGSQLNNIGTVETPPLNQVQDNKEENNVPVHKAVYSEEDPERPLFPEGEEAIITDDDFIDAPSNSLGVGNDSEKAKITNHAAGNKPASIRSVSYTETIDDVDIPYHDYYAPTLGQKFKKALPWIILAIVVLGFIGYNVIPMFNVKYDYESKLDRLNLTTADTLPIIEEEEIEVSQTKGVLDSVQTKQDSSESQKSDVKEPADENKPVAEQHIPDRRISENLKIDVINKAQQYIQRYPPKQPEVKAENKETEAPKETPKVAAKPKYDTIRRGVTLRNLATKHYGFGDYWVYIYQANRGKIRNPNYVPIGTTLAIPSLSSYGINNPNDQREIQKAKNMAERILR